MRFLPAVVAVSIVAAAPVEAQTRRSGARVAAGLAVSALGAAVLFIKPEPVPYGGDVSWAVTHEDWTCAWNSSADTSPARERGLEPTRIGEYCGLVGTDDDLGLRLTWGGHPYRRDNPLTARVPDDRRYSGREPYSGRVTPGVSIGQRLAGGALIVTGVVIAAAFSEVPAVRDVDLRIDRGGFRASGSFGW